MDEISKKDLLAETGISFAWRVSTATASEKDEAGEFHSHCFWPFR